MMALASGWGTDLLVGPGGDIAVVPARAEVQYRIIRRLLTNPGDYIWHSGYGAGLGGYVVQPFSPQLVESTILYHLEQEPFILLTPAPKISASDGLDVSFSSVSVTIQYHTRDMPESTAMVIGLKI